MRLLPALAMGILTRSKKENRKNCCSFHNLNQQLLEEIDTMETLLQHLFSFDKIIQNKQIVIFLVDNCLSPARRSAPPACVAFVAR